MMIRKKILAISCAVAISIFNTGVSQAITLSEYYSDQNVLYYDKNATAFTCAPSSGDTTTPTLSTAQNEKTIYQYFIGKLLTAEQSAGIVGNIWVETGGTFDPKTHQNGGGPGRGIAQWTSTERWVNLVNFARNQNRSEWDLMVQLDFIWYEFQGSEKAAYTHLIATKTIQEATTSFQDKYERAGDPHPELRLKYALEAYQKYNGLPGIGGTASGGGCTGSSVLGGTIVQVAEAEFAKRIVEQPPRCDAGNPSVSGSCGPEIDKYTDSTLEYWCADFVSWVYKTSGKPFTGGLSGGWRIPSVDGVRDWFIANGIYFDSKSTTYTPQPGDVVIYSYSHTDIVVGVTEDSIITIGGNTGVADTQNGDGVGKKTKSKNSPTIIGYGRLK